MTLLVVPAPRLHPFDSVRPELADWLRAQAARGDSIAQHGLRHLRSRRTEFAGLDAQSTAEALDTGLRLLRAAGLPPRGFVAPDYSYPFVLRRALPCRYGWWADLRRVHTLDRSLRAPALRPGDQASLPRASGAPLRLDVHPTDFDRPERLAAIAKMAGRRGRREFATYDELVTGASSRRRAAARAFRFGAGRASAPSRAAGAARLRPP
jgi:Uncharacterized protein conserved in bacteria (DUF2334)